MKFFRARISPVENLTFIAMMVGFDAILSLISALLPLSSIFIMLIAPLLSAAVSLFCKKRYLAIYVIAGIGICIAITAWNFLNTLFYMIPALITGLVYGLLWKAKLPASANVFLSSLLSLAFFYLSILLIRGLLSADMVQVLLTFVGRGDDPGAKTIFPLFALGYSYAQTGIMHAFVSYQIARLGHEENEQPKMRLWYPIFSIVFLIPALILAFLQPSIAYLFLGLGIYWFICSCFLLFDLKKPLPAIGVVLSLVSTLFFFAGLHQSMPPYSSLLLLSAPLLLASIILLITAFVYRNKGQENAAE